MRTIALIRCVEIGIAELRMQGRLAEWFGEDVWFVADNSAGKASWPEAEAGRVVEMTREKLEAMGLQVFHRSGWQCGNYCYYAADAEIADWSFAWLIEPDVRFSFARIEDFFGAFQEVRDDYLVPRFGPRRRNRKWHDRLESFAGPKGVFGGPYSITRMSRRAARHLREQRAAHYRELPADAGANVIPNDESFSATILHRDGFLASDMARHVPPATFARETFSTNIPVHPGEVRSPACADRVLHPVRADGHIGKLKRMSPTQFAATRDRVIATVGQGDWEEWTRDLPDAAVADGSAPGG